MHKEPRTSRSAFRLLRHYIFIQATQASNRTLQGMKHTRVMPNVSPYFLWFSRQLTKGIFVLFHNFTTVWTAFD